MSDLPGGWEWVKTGELFTFITSGSRGWAKYYSEHGAPFIRVGNLQRGSITPDLGEIQHVDPPKGSEGSRTQVQKDDILISITADIGRVALMSDVREVCYINQHVALARPTKDINAKYLAWYLSSDSAQRHWTKMQRGATKLGLGLDDIRSVDVPLPAKAMQERIVLAVEEQFSLLDAGVAAVAQALQNLKRMRASVLQSALNDALRCAGASTTPLRDLLSIPLSNGKSVPDGPDDGFPVLRLTAARNGWIDVTCSKNGAWTEAQAKPYLIRNGDYLVVRGNGSKHLVGRGALVRADFRVAYPDTMIRIRFDDTKVVPRYSALIWNSQAVRNQIEHSARTSAGIYKISQKDLMKINFPIPPIKDQARIEASARGVFDSISALETLLNAQLQRADALRSSILSAAFTGRLVSQDPAA